MADFEIVRSDSFVTIANTFLKDKNLSNKAKGVLAMILALPPTWDFSIKGMVAITKDGEASLRAAINEMKDNGYCAMKPVRINNKIARWKYLFSGEKLSEKLLCDFLKVENLNIENLNKENQTQNNIYKENYNKENNSLSQTACAERNCLQEEYYKLMDDQSWKEVICMNYHLTMDILKQTLIDFFMDCKCSGITQHHNEQDAKSHFNSWLKKNKNGNNSSNIHKQSKRGKTLDEFIEDSITELHRNKPAV